MAKGLKSSHAQRFTLPTIRLHAAVHESTGLQCSSQPKADIIIPPKYGKSFFMGITTTDYDSPGINMTNAVQQKKGSFVFRGQIFPLRCIKKVPSE